MEDHPKKKRCCKQQTLDSFVVKRKNVWQNEEDPFESERPCSGCDGPMVEENIYEGVSQTYRT